MTEKHAAEKTAKQNKEDHMELEHHDHPEHHHLASDGWFSDTTLMYGIAAVAVILLLNQWQYLQIASLVQGGGAAALAGGSISLGNFQVDDYSTLGPVHLSILNGESPVIPGYKSKVTKLPTISPHPIPAGTGDPAQDLVNALVPTGTPFYGPAAGVSFDDPIAALKTWGQLEQSIQLTGDAQKRWDKIVGSFTCDFCCGSPQNPTIINRCGCAHAGAWRGIAKFMIKTYGDKYSDAQIMGEMTRWKVLFYPGPIVKRVLKEEGIAA